MEIAAIIQLAIALEPIFAKYAPQFSDIVTGLIQGTADPAAWEASRAQTMRAGAAVDAALARNPPTS